MPQIVKPQILDSQNLQARVKFALIASVEYGNISASVFGIDFIIARASGGISHQNIIPDFVTRMFHIADENAVTIQVVPFQQRDFLLSSRGKNRESDNLLHWELGRTIFANARKMRHQAIKLFECRSARPFVAFADQAEFPENGQCVVEFLPGSPRQAARP